MRYPSVNRRAPPGLWLTQGETVPAATATSPGGTPASARAWPKVPDRASPPGWRRTVRLWRLWTTRPASPRACPRSPRGKAAATGPGPSDLGEKEAVLAANRDAFFTIPHFDGYAAVLVQLRKASAAALREAITDGWLACAPAKLADQYLHR